MFDTIKGIIGDIAAGAIKDQRIALSQEQLGALDLKLRDTLSQNTVLTQRVVELEKLVADRDTKIEQLQPTKHRLDGDQPKILKLFFDHGEHMSVEDIAMQFRLQKSVADSHVAVLLKHCLIDHTVGAYDGFGGFQPDMYAISQKGREYIMEQSE